MKTFIHQLSGLEQQLLACLTDRAVNVTALQFDIETFDELLFAQHNIRAPKGMERWVKKRQAEYLAGRIAAQISLQSNTDIPTGQHREPIWPAAISGSITHHHNLALAITSAEKNRRLGIDVEAPMSAETLAQTHAQFLSTAELALIQTAPGALKDWLPTAVFSAKESFFKAMFPLVQSFFDFDAIQCIGFDERVLNFQLCHPPQVLTQCSALNQPFSINWIVQKNQVSGTDIITLMDMLVDDRIFNHQLT